MYPTVTTKRSKQKEVVWQKCRLCLSVPEYQILGGKHVLILGQVSGKIWWLKMYNTFRKSTTADGLSCVARNPSGFFIILAISYIHLSWYQTHVNMWFQRNGKSEQFLETVYPRQRFFQLKHHSIGSMGLATRTGAAMSSLPKISLQMFSTP